MTEGSRSATATVPDERAYSPGLEGVVAGETALSNVDGERGRLLYRGYRIGDLVERGTYPAVANLLWTGEWDPDAQLPDRARAGRRDDRPPGAADDREADGRAADRRLGVGRRRRRSTGRRRPSRRARSPRSRRRRSRRSRGSGQGLEPVDPDPSLDLVAGLPVPAQRRARPTPATARALDAYFIVGAEHGLNASTFTARVITSTRSDLASAVVRRDRRDEGAAPRRRAVGGRRADPRGRLARARRAVGARHARPRASG